MGLTPCWRESWREVAPVVLCRLLGVDRVGQQLADMGEGGQGDVGRYQQLLHGGGCELADGLAPVPLPHARAGGGEGPEGRGEGQEQGQAGALDLRLQVVMVELGRPDRAVGGGGEELFEELLRELEDE